MRAHRRPLRSNDNLVLVPAEVRGPDLAAAGLFEVGGAKPSNTAQCAWARWASHANAPDYRTAIGATVEPVPPWIFSGSMMKANS